jgi:hypothetical protein
MARSCCAVPLLRDEVTDIRGQLPKMRSFAEAVEQMDRNLMRSFFTESKLKEMAGRIDKKNLSQFMRVVHRFFSPANGFPGSKTALERLSLAWGIIQRDAKPCLSVRECRVEYRVYSYVKFVLLGIIACVKSSIWRRHFSRVIVPRIWLDKIKNEYGLQERPGG